MKQTHSAHTPPSEKTEPEEYLAEESPAEESDLVDDAMHTGGHRWLRHFGVGEPRSEGGDRKLSGTRITSLGSLEAEIMGLLWEIGRPATNMDVAEASLYKRRSQNQELIAFSTINTTLRRLAEKGMLVGQKGDTRVVYYVPTIGREEMAARILNNVSETLLGRSLHGLIPKLMGSLRQRGASSDSATGQEEIERLLHALEEAARSADVD